MMILFIINVGQAFCEKSHNSVSKDIMSGIDENDDDPALMHPLEMFFPGLIIQYFQPEEIPTAVNEQAVLPAQIPTIEQQEQEVENVSESYLGSLAGTDTGFLVQAVQTGDMQPYVSFYRGQAKHRINRFLDQVVPGDDQISCMVVNGWSKGDFKAAFGHAVDIAIFHVAPPASYRMIDLVCADDELKIELSNLLEMFLDSIIPDNIPDNIDALDLEALSKVSINGVPTSYGFSYALLPDPDTEEISLDEHAEVGFFPAFPQNILAGTDTCLLMQAMQTGDMQPYVTLCKDKVKSRMNEFLDNVFPGDDEIGFIDLAINHHLLSRHTKGAFKTAINETIDTAVVQVDLPTGYRMRDLEKTYGHVGFELYLRIADFFDSLTDDMNMLDPSIIANRDALSKNNLRSLCCLLS
ncbi:MAG: hypothetical protein KBD04_02405 [Proteobacteria bacterium]|nr:hypothetical protein [Pseudomonadota bacterium]